MSEQTDQLEKTIEQAKDQLSDTIQQLYDRANPKALADNASNTVKALLNQKNVQIALAGLGVFVTGTLLARRRSKKAKLAKAQLQLIDARRALETFKSLSK